MCFLVLVSFVILALPTPRANAAFRQGDESAEIAAIQQKLVMTGYDIGIPDVVYGTQTETAIKQYQASQGLTADGIVGADTYRSLMGTALPVGRSSYGVSRGFGSSLVRSLISTAFQYMGVPYVWGGANSWGFDCSGFTQFVFAKMGISIPRTADVQYYNNPKVSMSNLQAGDLVFFQTYESGPSHCGIYLGGGEFIHAASSTGVGVASLSNSYWSSRYWGASRVL